MTTDRDVTRAVRSWLEQGVTVLPERVLDEVIAQLPATPQRRRLIAVRRVLRMNTAFKAGIAAAAVVAVTAVGISLLPGAGSGVGGPGQTSPSPVASPSLGPTQSGQGDRMTVAGSTMEATVDLPEGWDNNEFAANIGDTATGGMRFILSVVDNTFEEPCTHVPRNPAVASTVEAVAAALGDIPGTTATAPIADAVGVHNATFVEVTLPATLPCAADQFYLWQDAPGATWWPLAPAEMIQIWILDIEGQPFIIAASSWPTTSGETKAEFQQILDSIEFVAGP
jgi:hypothetical protein